MNEEKAVAILMANLKGSKNKPSNLLDFAEACRTLKKKWGFKQMSEYFHVSQYMLRQIDKINEHKDEELKKLIKNRKLGIEACYHLWRLDEKKRSAVSQILRYLTTDEIRVFIHLLRENPKKSAQELKKIFDANRDKKIQLLVIPLEPDEFKMLEERAKKSKKDVHDYALKMIKDSFKKKY